MVVGVSPDQARWKPSPESWSILEVINHLYDEEQRDFPVRLNIILFHSEQKLPPIDPERWVVEEKYNEKPLDESLRLFLSQRQQSLQWLRNLNNADWRTPYHASFGTIQAGDILAAWAAHDLLHLRQFVELHYLYTTQIAKPYSADYAGT